MLQLAPPIILVFSYIGAALIVAEVGLPSFGLLGLTGFATSGLAIASAVHQDFVAWPLAIPLLAAAVLGLLLLRGGIVLPLELACAAAVALAGIAWGMLNHSPLSIVIGVAFAAAIPYGFRRLHRSTRRLLDGPGQSGMDALVGQPVTFVTWNRGTNTGSVRVDGSLWNARPAPGQLAGPDFPCEVTGYDRLTLYLRHKEAT